MKVFELNGVWLDYWVARGHDKIVALPIDGSRQEVGFDYIPCYSTDWSLGGPIIERGKIVLLPPPAHAKDCQWCACSGAYFETIHSMDGAQEGPTPLIAGMRAFVVEKFGEEVPPTIVGDTTDTAAD
ncbi:phage protein NinX family protein [Noviherbaspirillum saxi]|uniref:DUF2591 domain-containing protein n=1 Tax=Noviherbaspirillum saxi TaxID=2320863 RepID=A0A3A3FS70_9BURK|nr:phage protein NinX family protein [Noviherbaspirillum saxi]RJF99002.1 DUF2591 domain-containing protein [Noviherbaspirillum saxi]